jgi:spermidine synthase
VPDRLDGRWTFEEIAPGEAHCHRVTAEIAVVDSGFQRIEVLETEGYGRGLFLDGRIQHVAADEYTYSESMVHPAMQLLGGTCRRALCIGGGPGGIVRELLTYPGVREVVQVEIDTTVVDVARRHLSAISGSFREDPRYQLVVADALDYLAQDGEPFDLIVNDLSEPLPDSPAGRLFAQRAVELVRSRLTADRGLYVSWCGSVGPRSADMAARIHAVVADVFDTTCPYVTHPQSYGTVWLTTIGAMRPIDPLAVDADEIDRQLARTCTASPVLYDGVTHHHMFRIPKDIRTALAGADPADPIELLVRTGRTQ